MKTKRQKHVDHIQRCEENYEKMARSIAREEGFDLEVEGHDAYKVTSEARELLSTFHRPWYKVWRTLKYGY